MSITATLVFSSTPWEYSLVCFLILCGGVLFKRSFGAWRKTRSRGARVFASGGFALAIVSFWMAYDVYTWFYALRVNPNQSVVVSHLWPRGEVTIPIDQISEIRVFRMFDHSGKTPSPYIQIVLKNGKRVSSTAPLPPAEEIEREISSLPARRNNSTRSGEWTTYELVDR